ncbi:Transmembrane anterior posterior transformation protein 1 [Galemys pyrenaicus]|uniref:Transmembrane anterior posterior transformation protein 1 n=1 Tax=Galemys pyrenaicus TaxID=202257 RepID=A0A8J6A0A8_GALPY|nr:Transmembrane anterior posterior transformation protein 1 [Galemys pyrenaicus]
MQCPVGLAEPHASSLLAHFRDRRLLQPAQVCDILKGVILVICYFMMHYVDYSMMYHLIRGQSVIKLYIIYNMLEVGVADRLFSSFGQDILDALYWTATEPKERKRAHIGVIPHFFMAVLYVCILLDTPEIPAASACAALYYLHLLLVLHAILIMVQATTLNVAFNSHNKSLLTIMMSNNFVEIKGSVFKKFEKNNLFQMSNSAEAVLSLTLNISSEFPYRLGYCSRGIFMMSFYLYFVFMFTVVFLCSLSDIKERFTNYVLLLIVCLRNMEQFSWNPAPTSRALGGEGSARHCYFQPLVMAGAGGLYLRSSLTFAKCPVTLWILSIVGDLTVSVPPYFIDHLWVLFPDVCMVIASEIAVDIVKHAFITKFNDITADVYSEYRASLAFDLVSSRQKNAYTDYSDSVARRMGFIPLPLAVLLIRVVTSSIKVQGILSCACVILFYFGLISLKVLNSIVLLGKSCQYVKEAKMEEKLFSAPPTSTPGKPCSKSQNKSKPSQGT